MRFAAIAVHVAAVDGFEAEMRVDLVTGAGLDAGDLAPSI